MALVITAVPSAWASAHGDIVFTVKDTDKVADPVTYPNFKFIADVYIGDLVLAARLKAVPDPVNGVGIFNVGMICRSYISAIFNPVPNTLRAQVWLNYIELTMKFGEEWNYTPVLDIVADGTNFLFNSYESRGTIGIIEQKIGRAATNRPDDMKVFFNSPSLFIPFLPNSTDPVPIVIIPQGGGFSLTTSYTPGFAYEMATLNLCPTVINSLQPGTITLATTSYTVQIGDRTFTVKLICEPVYDVYPLHFLNQYGGFDTVFFNKVSRKMISVTKTDYGLLPYTVGSDGSVSYKSDNGIFNETDSTYASQFVEKLQLNSDFLTDEEYTWLRELLLSPMLYIEDVTGLFPIKITDTDYEAKKAVNDGLTNLTINLQFGNQLNAQYR